MLPVLFAALLATPSADAVLGRWETQTRHGIVDISRCGASICGRIVTSDGLRANPNLPDKNNKDAALRGRPLKGVVMLSGFHAEGDGWTGGSIYNPENGKTYSSTVTPIDADHLKVRGCIFVPLCKSETWTRVR